MAEPSESDQVDDSLPTPETDYHSSTPSTGLPVMGLIKKTTTTTSLAVTNFSKRQKPSSDIRSFFASTTAPHLSSSSSSTPSRNTITSRIISSRPTTRMKNKKDGGAMSQLMLDLSNRPTTQTCKECGMSFVMGVDEDMEMHEKHHRGVVEGVEWPLLSCSDCRVVWRDMDGVSWSEQIVKLSLEPRQLKRSGYKAKVDEILCMVNRSLDAQELTEDQLRDSVLYLYLGSPSTCLSSNKKRRLNRTQVQKQKVVVKAMCVAARIEYGYQIVGSPNSGKDGESLLRFGDTTCELYCS